MTATLHRGVAREVLATVDRDDEDRYLTIARHRIGWAERNRPHPTLWESLP